MHVQVFAFTNHTVMPEALERWPVSLMERLLPRHMQIIYDINYRHLQQLRSKIGDDWDRIERMSIIEEGPNGDKVVRMAYLGVIASHTVNGVAAIHSQIIIETVFKDFYDLWPEKFINITNGVTQRRWLAFCNNPLRELITKQLGSDAWIGCDSVHFLLWYHCELGMASNCTRQPLCRLLIYVNAIHKS